jgi:hypothetical protein
MLASGYSEANHKGVVMLFETDAADSATESWRFVDLLITDGRHNMNVREFFF